MDITKSIVKGREEALLLGDYNTYRQSLSRRLHTLHKTLGRSTKKNAKYSAKPPVTAEDIGGNREYLRLLILTAERAWAHAMHVKSSHANDSKISGSTRTHIVSRLHKASSYAKQLFELCSDQIVTRASDNDVLEARAYLAALDGAAEFERHSSESWGRCVRSYSIARILYSILETATNSDTFKDLLSATIDPSIRYAAHQLRLPRTIAVPEIARRSFLEHPDPNLVSRIENIDAEILKDPSSRAKADTSHSGSVPKTITWRSRTVELEDASIATALGSVIDAEKALSKILSGATDIGRKEKASAYDDILVKSQDAVDATKMAIDELLAEGVGPGDTRMQSLQITRTYVNYEMISWRIGRNRVLTGEHDGAHLGHETIPAPKRRKATRHPPREKEEGVGRKLARLRERVVMYDATLQSLDAIRDLPGVAADAAFVAEIGAKHHYFRALKCLSIARSHDLLSQHALALALLARALAFSTAAQSSLPAEPAAPSSPPTITIPAADVSYLHATLTGELHRQRALLELANANRPGAETGGAVAPRVPLIDRLHQYPAAHGGVDLLNLVAYPPKLEPVPVKPLFFDVAWNYIGYPGRAPEAARVAGVADAGARDGTKEAADARNAAQQKRGWFGFGR